MLLLASLLEATAQIKKLNNVGSIMQQAITALSHQPIMSIAVAAPVDGLYDYLAGPAMGAVRGVLLWFRLVDGSTWNCDGASERPFTSSQIARGGAGDKITAVIRCHGAVYRTRFLLDNGSVGSCGKWF